ncbi:hypothetical protein BV25DRAFT_1832172 [Artomyces pyxidatus]|uniref:Uncharacterized protein n=1 Tax=Artomyces pyxidatus TaxID=48021 RepID=A0ACB8SJY5_9AGAM|nr:hypothetical protein BV25DRAFT_1832172 [Artomyces pyxidatus]
MGLNLDNSLVEIKLTESVAGFVAVCMTVARMWIRRDRYWWDDAWAFFSLLNLLVQVASVFMHVENPAEMSKMNRVTAYYLMAATFYTVIWSARISILFSIIRIDPDERSRYYLKWLAAAFVGAIAFFLAQLLWVCEPDPSWKDLPSPQCHLTKQVAICQLVSDIFADMLLILLPLRLLHGIKDMSLYRRLIFIFSTSIVTTIVSMVHAAYIITSGGSKVLVSALVEDCLSLTVANVPVVATAVLRVITSKGPSVYVDTDGRPNLSSVHFKTGGSQWGTTIGALSQPQPTAVRTHHVKETLELVTTGSGEQLEMKASGDKKDEHYIHGQWAHDPEQSKAGVGESYLSVGSVRRDAEDGVVRIENLPVSRR